jgi:hypothetical protein
MQITRNTKVEYKLTLLDSWKYLCRRKATDFSRTDPRKRQGWGVTLPNKEKDQCSPMEPKLNLQHLASFSNIRIVSQCRCPHSEEAWSISPSKHTHHTNSETEMTKTTSNFASGSRMISKAKQDKTIYVVQQLFVSAVQSLSKELTWLNIPTPCDNNFMPSILQRVREIHTTVVQLYCKTT